MARGKLTPAELLALHNNPYVIDANETRIIYSNEFKFHFLFLAIIKRLGQN